MALHMPYVHGDSTTQDQHPVQQQAPVHAALPCFIANCAYVTNPNYDGLQQMALHMPHVHGDSTTQDQHPETASFIFGTLNAIQYNHTKATTGEPSQ